MTATDAGSRLTYEPDGQAILLGSGPCCPSCPYGVRGRCKGPSDESLTPPAEERVGCFDAERQADFYYDLHRSFDPSRRRALPLPELPAFVPQLVRGMPRGASLPSDRLYAVSLRTLIYRGGSVRFRSASDMRRALRLPADARVMLLGTAADTHLEAFWKRCGELRSWERLAALDFELATSFTFSVYEVDPRFDQIYNQERNAYTYDLLVDLGIPSIPFVFTAADEDVEAATLWLGDHPEVDVVAVLAQFFPSQEAFEEFLDDVDRIRESAARRLRFLVVGAATAGKARQLFSRFPKSTVVTSQPAMRAIYGRVADPELSYSRALDLPKAEVLTTNLRVHDEFCAALRTDLAAKAGDAGARPLSG